MSTQLPKFTIQSQSAEPSKTKKLLFPVLLVLCGLLGYFGSLYLNKDTIKTLNERNDVLETLNDENQNKILLQDEELSLLKTEKKVKQEAILQLQNDYKNTIINQNKLKSEINFYERLLSPNVKNKGLRVFEASAIKKAENLYAMKVILVQKLERAREIAGKYRVEVIGKQDNQPKTIQISDKVDQGFKFKYFHNVSLDFSVPEGFKAEQLVVKLFPSVKKSKTIEYTVDWQSLIK